MRQLVPQLLTVSIRIGDYNLVALDYLPKCDLHWVGNCNELNAGMSPQNGDYGYGKGVAHYR